MKPMWHRIDNYIDSLSLRPLLLAWMWIMLYLSVPAFLLGWWHSESQKKRPVVVREVKF